MKRLLLFSLLMFLVSWGVYAQQPATSFETDFSSGSPTGIWGDWLGEMTVTYENDEMKVAINRTAINSWDRLAFWLKPFDIGPSPFFSMRIKSDVQMEMTVTFKDTADNTIDKTINLTGGDTWDEIFLNVTDDLGDLKYTVLAEMQFDPSPGSALVATLYIDDVKVGDAAKPDLSPPTILVLENMLLDVDAGLQTVLLNGISDGGDGGQTIFVSAQSDNTELIPSVSVTYTSPNTTGSLSFTPAAGKQGEATITVTVTDDGLLENETKVSFKVLIMKFGGTGFTDNFDSLSIDTLWDLTNPDYTLDQSDGILHIEAHKNAGWESFTRDLGGFYDFSANPWLNVDVKGSIPFYLHVYLKDVNNNTAMKESRIMQSDDFVTASFDFSDASGINLTQIIEIIFAFNGNALTFDADIWFEHLAIGSDASNLAYVAAVPDLTYFVNSGSHSLYLTDITNTTSISAESKNTVVENPVVSSITNGMATFSFDMITDAVGVDTVVLTAHGAGDYDDYSVQFTVAAEDNAAPEIDQVADQVAAVGEEVTVKLSGINDGNRCDEQEINITATSSDAGIVPDPLKVEYDEGPYADLIFTPVATGTADITVSLKDNGGGTEDSASLAFSVEVFTSLNGSPTIDPVDKQNVFNDAGEITLELTGITDGDDGTQNLTITAVSSVDTVVPNPVVIEYTGGETALLKYTPYASNTGISTITLKILDDGGTMDNDGNDSIILSFDVETRTPPLTGWVVPIGEGDPHDYFSAEQEGIAWFLSYVDSVDFKALEIILKNKWEFGGLWMDMPNELDLTDYPYISYEVYPVGSTLTKTVDGVTVPITDTYHWNYFYDVNAERNILNSVEHMLPVPPDQWTTLSFDYSDPGDMLTDEGEEILNDRISDVLFNLHWRKGTWPFTDMSGTIYYRNIRIGDQAVIPPKTPVATIDNVPDQAIYINSGEHTITLSGISDGEDTVSVVTLTAVSSRKTIVPDPVVGDIQSGGSAVLTYIAGDKTGSSTITVTVSAVGSDDKIMRFDVDIVSDKISAMAKVNIDRTLTYQTIEGFGTFQNEKRWLRLYATDLGASAMRVGLISNQIEPVNDNNNPDVLDMNALNYDAFDWEYFRMAKEAGVKTFILTSWSPPAWMKTNLSLDWKEPHAEWNTDAALNRLEYHQYEEFAESMVAVVKMFEQESGVHIEAIGLQNEPAFDEPYASAILDLQRFAELIEVVGKRFEKEGITTRLFMPEQVVGQFNNSNIQYLDALQNDPGANPYCDIFAVHGYGEDGITPGAPSYSEWKQMYNKAQEGEYPKKVWMSETHIGYQDWSSAMSTAGAIHGALWAGNIGLWTNWSFGDMQLTKNQPNSTFYSSKNYFKYIRPGAVRIETSSNYNDILVTAFEHYEDGTFTVVLINKSNNPISVDLAGNNLPNVFRAFRTSRFEDFLEVDSVEGEMFILPASSITTLYATENPELTINDVPDMLLRENDPEQTIQLEGISDGAGGIASLTLEVETTDPALITNLDVANIQPDGTSELSFTPGNNMTGTAQVIITLADGSEYRKVTFYVVIQSTVDIPEVDQNTLIVYPNPATDILYVHIPVPGLDELIISDLTGRKLLEKKIIAEQLITVNIGSMTKGLYIITLSNDREQYRARFIIE